MSAPEWSETAKNFKLGRYRHYSGKEYEAIGVARHSETLEEMVVYKALYGEGAIWVRPLGMFLEEVEVDGRKIPRFTLLG
jgi:hypothetical protein